MSQPSIILVNSVHNHVLKLIFDDVFVFFQAETFQLKGIFCNYSMIEAVFELTKGRHRPKSIKKQKARQVHNAARPGKQSFIDLIVDDVDSSVAPSAEFIGYSVEWRARNGL